LLALDGAGEPVDLPLSAKAHEYYRLYYDSLAERQAETESDARAAVLAKLEGGAARLALVCALAANPQAVEVDDGAIGAGIALALWFEDEARRVYESVAERPMDRERRHLADWISARSGRCSVRDLQNGGPRRLRSRRAAISALEDLAGAGFGHWRDLLPGAGGGRPTRVFVLGDCDGGDETSACDASEAGDKTSADLSAARVATGDETSEVGEGEEGSVAVASVGAIAEPWEAEL
jgi:hypothetical protein